MCGVKPSSTAESLIQVSLPKPPSNTGAFQSLSIHDAMPGPEGAKTPQFYADAGVIAYRRAPTDVPLESLHPKVTASAGAPDPAILSDGELIKTTRLPIPNPGESAWIQWEFATPQTMRSITTVMTEFNEMTVALTGVANPEKSLEASDDGQNFRAIVKLPGGGAPEHTVSFLPVTAKFFRVTFLRTPPGPRPAWMGDIDPASLGVNLHAPPTDYEIAELALRPGARVNRFEEKAAFVPVPDLYPFATPRVSRLRRRLKIRCHRPDFEAAPRRYSRLDTPAR